MHSLSSGRPLLASSLRRKRWNDRDWGRIVATAAAPKVRDARSQEIGLGQACFGQLRRGGSGLAGTIVSE